MYWRFYGLVSLLFLFSHCYALADERVPSPLAHDERIKTEAALARLLFPMHDLLGMAEQVRCCPRDEGDDQTKPRALLTVNERTSHLGPPLLPLPAVMQDLVSPLLLRLIHRKSPVVSTSKTTSYSEPSLGQMKKKDPLPRVDQVWRVAPTGSLARTYSGMTIDGGVNLGLEVHAGSTTKDRATNAIKGTTSTQVSLWPARSLPQRFGKYFDTQGTDEQQGNASKGQLRMVLATNGEYALNPSTRDLIPKGEVVGTLSWMTAASDRFIRDPWQFVAFRVHPTVSCEGRRPLGEETDKTVAKQGPLATLTGSIGGDLRLDFLSPQLAASGNYHYGQHLTGTQTKWEQVTVSWNYQLNTQVFLGGSFTQNKRTLNPQPDRAFKLEMGVTF